MFKRHLIIAEIPNIKKYRSRFHLKSIQSRFDPYSNLI